MSRIQPSETAFRDSPRQRTPRVKDNSYLGWIRTLPCIISGASGVDAAHVRFADMRFAKRQVGTAEKPNDAWTLPLLRRFHTEQHSMSERAFWEFYGVDPLVVCASLYMIYTLYDGDEEMAAIVLRQKGRL